jgi:hypothetical protein
VVLLSDLARPAVVRLVGRAWGTSYPSPVLPPPFRQVTPLTGVDTFDGTTVKPKEDWNHTPDNGKWSVNNGLTPRTATVTNDLYWARNTLTHRIQGPTSTATIQLDYATIRDGQQLEHHRHRHRNASANVTGGHIRLRAAAGIRPGASRPGTFSYSTDSSNFTRLGPRSPWATPSSSSRATASPFPTMPRRHSAAPSTSHGSR